MTCSCRMSWTPLKTPKVHPSASPCDTLSSLHAINGLHFLLLRQPKWHLGCDQLCLMPQSRCIISAPHLLVFTTPDSMMLSCMQKGISSHCHPVPADLESTMHHRPSTRLAIIQQRTLRALSLQQPTSHPPSSRTHVQVPASQRPSCWPWRMRRACRTCAQSPSTSSCTTTPQLQPPRPMRPSPSARRTS